MNESPPISRDVFIKLLSFVESQHTLDDSNSKKLQQVFSESQICYYTKLSDDIIRMLDTLFATDLVSWWFYEAKNSEDTALKTVTYEKDGNKVIWIIETAGNLYDLLIEEYRGDC